MTGLNGIKRTRQRSIREIVAREPVTSQQELADRLAERGFAVTQATVSRDITELGLVKIARGDRHVYVAPEDIAAPPTPPAGDERLRRILSDIPVSVGRSGLILVLTGTPGTASVIAQAIDESDFVEQEGTLAGDNTLLVLFADEARLERWLDRFRAIQALTVPEGSTGPVSVVPASVGPVSVGPVSVVPASAAPASATPAEPSPIPTPSRR
jgi:transcriptional regulator of arginine metabolism